MNILIHAGRHKTGTSTLQRTFCNNRAVLYNHGFLYPLSGVRGYGHHELAERLSKRNENNESSFNEALKIWEDILEECSGFDGKLLLSSEAFQNCSPKYLSDFFCDHNVEVVFYIRNKVDYLVSSYLQKVHATSYASSLEDFLSEKFRVNYVKYFSGWEKVFGSRVFFRVFDRAQLLKGDICEDFFCNFLSVIREWDRCPEDANPSLPVEVLEFKRALNIVRPDLSHSKKIYESLAFASSELTSPNKFLASDDALFDSLKNIKEEDFYIESVTGVACPFFYRFSRFPSFEKNLVLEVGEYIGGAVACPDLRKIENLAIEFGERYLESFSPSLCEAEWEVLFSINSHKLSVGYGVELSEGFSEDFYMPSVHAYGYPQLDYQLSGINFSVKNKVVVVNEAKLLLPYGVVLRGNEILEESLWMSKLKNAKGVKSGKEIGWNWFVERSLLEAGYHIDGKVLVCYSNIASNYFHWHFEVLAKLWEYIRRSELDEIDYVYAGCFSKDSYKYQSLLALGVPPRKILHNIDVSFTASQIIYPILSSCVDSPLLQRMSKDGGEHHKGWNKSFLSAFPEKVVENLSINKINEGSRLFVNRLERGTRKILNVSDVKRVLDKYGFEEFDPGTVPYRIQVEKFSHAEVVVGIHGAGLTNCIYCKKDAALLEFIPSAYDDVGYRVLSQIKSMDYIPLYCDQPVRKEKKPKNDDIFVDIESLEFILKERLF